MLCSPPRTITIAQVCLNKRQDFCNFVALCVQNNIILKQGSEIYVQISPKVILLKCVSPLERVWSHKNSLLFHKSTNHSTVCFEQSAGMFDGGIVKYTWWLFWPCSCSCTLFCYKMWRKEISYSVVSVWKIYSSFRDVVFEKTKLFTETKIVFVFSIYSVAYEMSYHWLYT